MSARLFPESVDARAVLPAGVAGRAPESLCDGRSPELVSSTLVEASAEFNAGGSYVTDHVVAPQGTELAKALSYRKNLLRQDLSRLDVWEGLSYRQAQGTGRDRFAPGTGMTVALTGATGTVGRRLLTQLVSLGFKVVVLTRPTSHTPARVHRHDGLVATRVWDPAAPNPRLVDGVDALIHLAGAPVAGRFTAEHIRRVRESRVEPTRKLCDIAAASGSVHTVVCANAIGIYGHAPAQRYLGENAPLGHDVLADICRDWENATRPFSDAGGRVVSLRTGIVISGGGGIAPLLARALSTRLGGPLGNGAAGVSWISIDDLTDIYIRALLDDTMAGPINAVSPRPVSNHKLTRDCGAALRVPTAVRVPTVAPKLIFGRQGAQLTALADQWIIPEALEKRGHTFRYDRPFTALLHEFARESLRDCIAEPCDTPDPQ